MQGIFAGILDKEILGISDDVGLAAYASSLSGTAK